MLDAMPLPGLACLGCRTGDLATAAPNNYIHVVDRKKDMLLVGGENVYSEWLCTLTRDIIGAWTSRLSRLT